MGDAVDGVGNNGSKRVGDESAESPEAKRLRAVDLIFLLEDFDSADRNLAASAARDLDIVLKSFEEEIAALSPQHHKQTDDVASSQPPLSTSTSGSDQARQSDLDYLLQASDDQLGLPPTAPSSAEREAAEGHLVEEGVHGVVGLGQIWGFDDEIPSYYDALGLGGSGHVEDRAAAEGGDAVFLDGGLFEYPDATLGGSPDFSDYSWRPESLPAV